MGKPLPAITAPLEVEEPLPSRWRGVKRALIGVGVVLLLLVGLRVWWGWEASRQLEAEIALYRSTGEDFEEPAVADGGNAAMALWEAAKGIRQTEEYRKLHDVREWPSYPWSAAALGWAEAAVRANQGILEQVRAARALRKVRWRSVRERAAASGDSAEGLYAVLQLEQLLRDAARLSHQRGDHAAAAEYLRDVLFTARTIGQVPELGFHLCALGLEARVADEILRLAWQAGLEGDAGVRPVERGQLRALIDELSADPSDQDRLLRALQGERWKVIQAMRHGGEPGAEPAQWAKRLGAFMLRPQHQLAATRGLRQLRAMCEAATAPNLPAAIAKAGPAAPGPRGDSGLALVEWQIRRTEAMWIGDPQPSLWTHFGTATLRRAAASSLAIQLYQADHDGRAPPRLAELVPAYLRQLPIDPLDAAGGTMGFGVVASRPFIYSVSRDGTDDLAAKTWVPAAGDEPSWRAPDLLFFLPQRPNPASRPSAGAQPAR